ncbi:hypothetical protein NUW58_g8001 [Xylaria curta]|uniref:Uncharacterized protein n=1 Tax=Xylaria curta TaxID=42375 RepID=A0ACC1ND33_9PEZI|nr:hypothetical protein NUW58_g8001 [Xylaria curta]
MMQSLLLGAMAFVGLASAYTGSQVSTTSVVKCSTAYGSGDGPRPTPIPTSEITEAVSSLFTAEPTTIPKGYKRVTDTTITVTQRTSLVVPIVLATVTSGIYTSWIVPTTTIATATWPVTTCTNGVSQKTVSKYTGTYTPVPGQATAFPESFGTQVFCTASLTSYITYFPTVTAETYATIHTTSTSFVYDYTTTLTSTLTYLTLTSPSATVTSTTISYVERGLVEPTRIACEETVTKTYDARCAPTNLISNHNGIGLVSGRYNGNVSVVYTRVEPYGTNPSDCCQSCLDNKGCGASMCHA